MKKYIFLFLFLFALLISCSEEEAIEEAPKNVVEVGNPTIEKPQSNTPFIPSPPKEETPPEPDPNATERSLTTGLPCTPEAKVRRPIAVMYNNNKVSFPQDAISNADIVYECDAEGGVTRLMAIFSDWENLSSIGSVRSARDYFISISQSHGAIFVNAGGSPKAYEKLKGERVDYVDGVNMYNIPTNTFYRDSGRIKNNGYEHSMMTDGSRLMTAVKKLGYALKYRDGITTPYSFNQEFKENEGKTAVSITLPHSSYITVRFQWDAASKKYLKYSFDEPHTDGLNSKQLAFENVVVLFVGEQVLDTEGRLKLDLTSGGSGYYISGGKYTEIKWTRKGDNAPFVLTENGEEISLNPGKTHITLFNKNQSKKVTIK